MGQAKKAIANLRRQWLLGNVSRWWPIMRRESLVSMAAEMQQAALYDAARPLEGSLGIARDVKSMVIELRELRKRYPTLTLGAPESMLLKSEDDQAPCVGAKPHNVERPGMSNSLSNLFDPMETSAEIEQPTSVRELTKLASSYLLISSQIEKLQAELKDLRDRQQYAENQLLDKLQGEIKSFRMETGHLITACTKQRFQLPPKGLPEERLGALRWLKRIGAKDMIAEDINPQTMQKFLRERIEQGKAVTPLIKTFEQRYLSVRKDS